MHWGEGAALDFGGASKNPNVSLSAPKGVRKGAPMAPCKPWAATNADCFETPQSALMEPTALKQRKGKKGQMGLKEQHSRASLARKQAGDMQQSWHKASQRELLLSPGAPLCCAAG